MPRSRKSLRLLLGVSLAAGALTAATVPAQAQSTTTLRLGYFANVTHAPALVGLQSGLFQEKLGDSVKIEPRVYNAGPTAVAALLSGAIDATFIGPNPAINGYAQSLGAGGALRIVAGSTSAGAFLVVKPSITKAADLKGKKIATPQLGNTQDVALRAWLKDQGFKTDTTGGGDVSVLPQANATTLDAFRSGTIDGAWVPEPWATRLVNEGGGTVLVDERKLWPEGKFVTTHLIVATKFLKEHPAVVKKLIKGDMAAVDFANDNRTVAQKLTIDAIKAATGESVDPKTTADAWENLTFTVDPIASSLAKSAKNAESLGLLQPVNLKGTYDVRLLNQLLKQAGKAPVSTTLSSKKQTGA